MILRCPEAKHRRIVHRGESESHRVGHTPIDPTARDAIATAPVQHLVTPVFGALVIGKCNRLDGDDPEWG